jgi:hypothetical protein
MARGWESKSIEDQQAELLGGAEARRNSSRVVLSAEQQRRNRQRDGLLLARTRLAEQLENTVHPKRRQMLQESLAELDRQLSSFEDFTGP